MTKAVQEARPSTVSVDSCGDITIAPSSMTVPCTGLLSALSELAIRKHALDAGQFESASPAHLTAALDAVWETRQHCDLLALAVQKTQPETGNDAAIKRDVLIFYSARVNPDNATLHLLSELVLGTVQALYPDVLHAAPVRAASP